MGIPFWSVLGYLVVTSTIGMVAGRRKGGRGVREFFVAGGQLSWLLLMPFMMGQYITTTAVVGTTEMAHELGVVSMVYYLGSLLGAALFIFGLAKFYVSIKKITIGEAFAILFDRRTRLACVLILMTVTALMMPIAFLGVGAILAPMLNIPYESGVWLAAAFVTAIAIFGGLRGIAWMNVIHIVVMIVCLIPATVASVNAAGGLGRLIESLPAEQLNWVRPGGFTITAWLISSSLMRALSAISVTAVFAAKDERSAKISLITSGVALVLFSVMPTLIGLAAYVIMPDISSRLALWEMGQFCGVTISTLVSIAVLAAIVSSTPGFLLSLGGIATRDVFLLIKPNVSERAQLFFSRIVMILLPIGGTLFAFTQPSLMGMVLKMAQVRAIFAIILLVSVFWRRLHPSAAFWTGLLGACSGFIWFLADSPFGIEPLWAALTIGILTLIIVSLRKRPSPFRGLQGLDITLPDGRRT